MARKNSKAVQGHHAKRKGRRKKKKPPPWNAKPHRERPDQQDHPFE